MLQLYRGKINLKDPLVAKHAEEHINVQKFLDPTRPHFERHIEKFIYWYTDPSRIKYPITAFIAGGQLVGIGPGSSRLVAQYLKGTKYMDCIVMLHDHSRALMDQLVSNVTPINKLDITYTCSGNNNWEVRLKEDQPVLSNSQILKSNKRYFWNKNQGMRWFYENELILDRSKPNEKSKDIAIVKPLGLFQSITHLVDNSPKIHKVKTFHFIHSLTS